MLRPKQRDLRQSGGTVRSLATSRRSHRSKRTAPVVRGNGPHVLTRCLRRDSPRVQVKWTWLRAINSRWSSARAYIEVSDDARSLIHKKLKAFCRRSGQEQGEATGEPL